MIGALHKKSSGFQIKVRLKVWLVCSCDVPVISILAVIMDHLLSIYYNTFSLLQKGTVLLCRSLLAAVRVADRSLILPILGDSAAVRS